MTQTIIDDDGNMHAGHGEPAYLKRVLDRYDVTVSEALANFNIAALGPGLNEDDREALFTAAARRAWRNKKRAAAEFKRAAADSKRAPAGA